jgi:hypothetical protein
MGAGGIGGIGGSGARSKRNERVSNVPEGSEKVVNPEAGTLPGGTSKRGGLAKPSGSGPTRRKPGDRSGVNIGQRR